jgi:hypothetical protein
MIRAGSGVSPASPWAWATPFHRATTKRKKNIYIYILGDIKKKKKKKIHGHLGDLAHVAGSSSSLDFFFIHFLLLLLLFVPPPVFLPSPFPFLSSDFLLNVHLFVP